MQQNFLQILMRAMVLVAVIPIHECAHGLAASWMGDHTARDLGRTTLNPLAHLDPIGSLALVFTGLGWAKPVPVDTRNFRNPKAGMAITALAGPAANLVLALVLVEPGGAAGGGPVPCPGDCFADHRPSGGL